MFYKFKAFLVNCREKRIERRNKPWSKKQKIIFLCFFGAAIIYVIISIIISGNTVEAFSLPSLNLSINGFDIMLICLLGIGLAVFKIRAYIKRRKGGGK